MFNGYFSMVCVMNFIASLCLCKVLRQAWSSRMPLLWRTTKFNLAAFSNSLSCRARKMTLLLQQQGLT